MMVIAHSQIIRYLHSQLKVSLPNEDLKTIDVDVKSDRVRGYLWIITMLIFYYQVIVLSHRYKCRVYWPRPVKAAEASSSWSPDTWELRVRVPVTRISGDLRFWDEDFNTCAKCRQYYLQNTFSEPMNHYDGWHSFSEHYLSLSVS